MSKEYGLILPGQPKKAELPVQPITRPSIFDESSDSDDGKMAPQLKMKSAPIAPGVMEKRLARRVQEKALEEDPTVFQYDELYDEMENKREVEKQTKSLEPKKPKYIGRLMESAERRKLENELRIERQVQKDREDEGEEFKDKESFVTATYRKKLEEMRIMEEREKRDEYLESVGDVTKQKDLDGFYRHLYEQKMGTSKEVEKPSLPIVTNTSAGDDEIAYKPIKSGRPQQRAYRKRNSNSDNEEEALAAAEAKKVHLQNNIDADSDFSIDSSSDDDDETAEGVKKSKETQDKSKVADTDPENPKVNGVKKPEDDDGAAQEGTEPTEKPPKPKKDPTILWKKRTVGEVYDEAVKRFHERKAARKTA